MDIIEKIDIILKDIEIAKNVKYIEKDLAVEVIESIIESVPEDKVLLETIKTCIENDWKHSNVDLIEKFNKILAFYGIIDDEENSFRKTILEKKGKTLVRKFVSIKDIDKIRVLLK
jgi:hypothetical protein